MPRGRKREKEGKAQGARQDEREDEREDESRGKIENAAVGTEEEVEEVGFRRNGEEQRLI